MSGKNFLAMQKSDKKYQQTLLRQSFHDVKDVNNVLVQCTIYLTSCIK
jgi:hypothetical protein